MPFLTRAKKFVRTLQRSSEERKKRWLVGSSAAAMLLVVVLWLAYLNVIVPVLSPQESIGIAAVIAPNADTDGSFFSTLGRGFSTIGDAIQSRWNDAARKITPLYDSIKQRFEPEPITLTPEGDAPLEEGEVPVP